VKTGIRRATTGDVDAVTAAICTAFHDDPVWSWVFNDPERRQAQAWKSCLELAHEQERNDWIWVTDKCEAISVWTPPGLSELTRDEEAQVPSLLADVVGSRAGAVLDAIVQYEAVHPRDVPHYYLGFLATHTDHRGHGLGMSLLRAVLEHVDGEGAPVYLESSNPVNHARYESVGFVPRETFRLPDGGPPVLTMWREPRPLSSALSSSR